MQRAHLDKVLSSYQHIGKVVYKAASSTTADDAHGFLRYFLLDMPVVPFLLAFHSIYAALSVQRLTRGRQFWLKSLVLTAFAAFGGSTLANVLCGQPAPLFTVSSNYMMSYVTLAWYVVNHSDLLRSMLTSRPVLAMVAFGATAAKARAITSFMDRFAELFPDAALGAIVLGGLAGSGGALFMNLEKIVQGGLGTASELSAPGWGFKSAYAASLAYYVGADPAGWVARRAPFEVAAVGREEMRFAVAMALCTHAALETLYGRHVNPLYPLEEVLYAVTGVRKIATEQEVRPARTGAQEIAGKEEAKAGKGGKDLVDEGLRRREGKTRTE